MRLIRIKSKLRTFFTSLKGLAVIGIIMVTFVAAGVNTTPAMQNTSRSQTLISEISIGKTLSGKLDETDMKLKSGQSCDEYTFEANGGQEIIISLSTFKFDAFLWFLNNEGKVIAINDDNGDGMGSIISNFSLPETGQYTIWVSSHGAGESGAYSLTLNEAPLINSPQTIFSSEMGEGVTLELSSPDIDSYLRILDHRGNIIKADNNSGSEKDALIYNFTLPETGKYYAWISSFFPGETGDYELSLICSGKSLSEN